GLTGCLRPMGRPRDVARGSRRLGARRLREDRRGAVREREGRPRRLSPEALQEVPVLHERLREVHSGGARSSVVCSRGWERSLAAVLAPLIWLAHPLGFVLLVTVGAYVVLAERLPPQHHAYLFLTSVLLLLGMHFLIRVHYSRGGVIWAYEPPFVHDGIDQLLLWPQYLLLARLFRAFLWACLLLDIIWRRHTARWWSPYLLPSELYALTLLVAVL